MTIPRLSLAHDRFQAADSAKYLISSTRQSQLPPGRPATFAADLAVGNIGGDPGDYRRGMAAFQVFDLEGSAWSRSAAPPPVCSRLDEQLGPWCAAEPFIYMVESPYEDFDDDFIQLRTCELTLERSSSTAAWRVDGHTLYQTQGTFIPETVGIGFGIWTMLPIRDGRSRSLEGKTRGRGQEAAAAERRRRPPPSAARRGGGIALDEGAPRRAWIRYCGGPVGARRRGG